jgi:hypothetical protein
VIIHENLDNDYGCDRFIVIDPKVWVVLVIRFENDPMGLRDVDSKTAFVFHLEGVWPITGRNLEKGIGGT